MDQFLLQSTATFSGSVDQLIAQGDDGELMDHLGKLPQLVTTLNTDAEGRFDTSLAVTNAVAAAAIALRRGKRGIVDVGLDALLRTYRIGLDASTSDDSSLRLWESAAASLWALGAVAVRGEHWEIVRTIVAQEPEAGGHYVTWLRHGQVESARGTLPGGEDNIIDLGERQLALSPGFGMADLDAAERLRFLCIFDQLAFLIVASFQPSEYMRFYPSYAKHPEDYVEPILVELRREGALRSAVFPRPDVELRAALREANELAISQAAQCRERGRTWRYAGFQGARIWMFIREGILWEDWQLT